MKSSGPLAISHHDFLNSSSFCEHSGLKVGSLEWQENMVEIHGELLVIDGCDDCIMGIVSTFGGRTAILYDEDAVINKLAQDMEYDEALEYFEFNIAGAYMGENSPAFFTR